MKRILLLLAVVCCCSVAPSVFAQDKTCAIEIMCIEGYQPIYLPSCKANCVPNVAQAPEYPSISGATPCGDKSCAPGQVCCNPSCGICTPPGGYCTMQVCGPEPAPVL